MPGILSKGSAPPQAKNGYTGGVPSDGKSGKPARERADKRVLDAGLADSRTRAQALILAGQVVIGDHAVAKPGDLVPADAPVRLKGEPMPYVSRGGSPKQVRRGNDSPRRQVLRISRISWS